MSTKIYAKLVRDNVPTIIAGGGGIPKTRTLSREGFKNALLDKLVEEATEARNANGRDELMIELVDVQETFSAILTAHGINPELLERLRKQRARVRGGFTKKIFLDSVKTK